MRAVATIEHEMKQSRQRIRELQQELFEAQCERANLHLGDVVVSDTMGEVKVTKLEFWGMTFGRDTIPSVHGVKRKKDGSWSKRQQYVYGGWIKKVDT